MAVSAASSDAVDVDDEAQNNGLLQLLFNSLVLSHITPHLEATDLTSLAATSKAFRYLIYHTPQVFRCVDLGRYNFLDMGDTDKLSTASVAAMSVDEYRYYMQPVRRVFSTFSHLSILSDVQVLVLDGLAFTADIMHDILNDPSYSVKILSLRVCRLGDPHTFRKALQYACGSKGSPKLKGLYIFGNSKLLSKKLLSQHQTPRTTSADTEPDHQPWYGLKGQQFEDVEWGHIHSWAPTLVDCRGLIAFDSVLCGGPRHLNSPAYKPYRGPDSDISMIHNGPTIPHRMTHDWEVATISLDGCVDCGSAPEGWTVWGEDKPSDYFAATERSHMERFPLLPDRLLSATRTTDFMRPFKGAKPARFIPRCITCLKDRYCRSCHRWWCETCVPVVPVPSAVPGEDAKRLVNRSCWECGPNCDTCIAATQRICVTCGGGFCTVHNDGASEEHGVQTDDAGFGSSIKVATFRTLVHQGWICRQCHWRVRATSIQRSPYPLSHGYIPVDMSRRLLVFISNQSLLEEVNQLPAHASICAVEEGGPVTSSSAAWTSLSERHSHGIQLSGDRKKLADSSTTLQPGVTYMELEFWLRAGIPFINLPNIIIRVSAA